MPRSRRFALPVVLALVGALALAGCGNAMPGVAATVGGTRYTEKQLDKLAEVAQGAGILSQLTEGRATILSWLVTADLARRAATERDIPLPAADYAGAAERMQLEPTSPLVKAYAEYVATVTGVSEKVQPVPPSDQDVRTIYDRLIASGQYDPATPFEALAQQIRGSEALARFVGVRDLLREVADRVKVVVNPRYRPLSGDLAGMPLPLADDSGTVTDLPRPSPSAQTNG